MISSQLLLLKNSSRALILGSSNRMVSLKSVNIKKKIDETRKKASLGGGIDKIEKQHKKVSNDDR